MPCIKTLTGHKASSSASSSIFNNLNFFKEETNSSLQGWWGAEQGIECSLSPLCSLQKATTLLCRAYKALLFLTKQFLIPSRSDGSGADVIASIC